MLGALPAFGGRDPPQLPGFQSSSLRFRYQSSSLGVEVFGVEVIMVFAVRSFIYRAC